MNLRNGGGGNSSKSILKSYHRIRLPKFPNQNHNSIKTKTAKSAYIIVSPRVILLGKFSFSKFLRFFILIIIKMILSISATGKPITAKTSRYIPPNSSFKPATAIMKTISRIKNIMN